MGSGGGRMKSYVIVAIPKQDDYVWNLSSEKVPHLTMLYLGENLENIDRVTEYIKHVTNVSVPKFGMDVERRGVLGDESADVLFFGQYNRKNLEEVRRYLLQDPDISKAYNEAFQYPTWTPHLTMGYPETPAKPDDRDYPGTTWVNFDRLALWTDDYEGVEFPLKDDTSDELRMSERGAEFLSHYGVRGMKWGVTRARVSAGVSAGGKALKDAYTPSRDAKSAQKYQVKAKLGGVRSLNNDEMRLVIQRMELEQRYRDLYGERQYHDEAVSRAKRYSKRGARWAGRFVSDVLKDGAASWIKRPGSNASGRTSGRAWDAGKQFGNVIDGTVVSPLAIGR